ncbi:MAG: hypothetical protein U9O50_03165 [Acidobacteriota bacterium]|nr:hypothetical protein [Acidobacteriota bacterium]
MPDPVLTPAPVKTTAFPGTSETGEGKEESNHSKKILGWNPFLLMKRKYL